MKRAFPSRIISTISAAILAITLAMSASAQDGRPAPQKPQTQADPNAPPPMLGQNPPTVIPHATTRPTTGPLRTRTVKEGKVVLAFNDVPVEETIPFIVESTGKVVMPVNMAALKPKKITLMNDEPIDRAAALDLLITALRLNGVGVIETNDVVILDLRESVNKYSLPVYTAEEDIMSRNDLGVFIVKIYRLKAAPADTVGERLQDNLPDYATLSIDPNSNQIILYGDVGLAQHIQVLINELDRNYVTIKTVTWHLMYADAQSVADQIQELFEESATPTQPGGARPPRNTPRRPGAPGAGGGGANQTPAGPSTPGPVVELRVSVNVQQNAVTASAEPSKIDAIDKLIKDHWDLPRPDETAKVYILNYTDPLKVRDLLQNILGQGGGGRSTSGGGRTGGGAGGRAGQPNIPGGGGGGGASTITQAIGDIYRIEAYPDQNKVVVLSKTKDALSYLDYLIEQIDQPSTLGLPDIIPLKHANAVNLADELNVLLAEAGTGGPLQRPAEGLNAQTPSGFGGDTGAGGTGTGSTGTSGTSGRGTTGGTSGGGGGTIEFPWQRGRPDDTQTEPSPLIGKVRIVPIIRQNALAVLAPIAQRYAITELIREFDKPGRQVMVSAIIAEVQLSDDLDLGLRFSSSAITPAHTDNALSAGASFTGTQNDILGSLFDTSVLDVSADINVLLQALRQKTNVRIIQEPRVFTADNQEAAFFNGQQIPFITNSVVNGINNGGVTNSFTYKDVGVLLNARPHITEQRNVDMEINLTLSAVVPGETIGGQAVLDYRYTTSKVIVKNGQTIVLSGLLRDVDSKVTRGIPGLSDIPLLGDLFKSYENSKSTQEIVAFITPTVVDNPNENDTNFNKPEREHLRDLAKPLREQLKHRSQSYQRFHASEASPEEPAAPHDDSATNPDPVAKPDAPPVKIEDLIPEPK